MKLESIGRISLFLILLLGIQFKAISQINYKITGDVFNQDSSKLFQGNIVIYNSIDSSFITGSLISNGEFDLTHISYPQVIVKISSLQHFDTYINVDNQPYNDSILLGQIILESNYLLDEVTVSTKVPIFESEGTKTIINVDKTILSESNTPLDILTKLPGIIVKDGQVSILGRGKAAIYMDGQRITEQQLDNVPVNQIIKFEIIKDPSARYDGDVSAVIKVITRNFHYEGTSVNIRSSIAFPTFLVNTGIGLDFRKNKWSIKANYGFTNGKTWSTTLNKTEKVNVFSTEMEVEENANINVQTSGIGISYQIDSLTSTSLTYNNNFSTVGIDGLSKNVITTTQIANYDALLTGQINQINHNFIANINRQIDTLGSSLFIGGQYTSYLFNMNEAVSENITINNISAPIRERQIESSNQINIISTQADYEKYFTKHSSISIGAKFSNAQTIGDLNMGNFINNEWVNVPSFSSKTLFGENIIASYATFKTTIKTLSISGGLRFEHTEAVGETTQQDQQNLSRTYNWFLPSFLITKQLNKELGIDVSLSYNTSVGRPSYNDLDPKLIYLDSLTSKQGNPLLLPQRDHSITAALNLGPMKFDLTYYHSFNAFKNVVKEGLTGENSITLYRENVQADRLYGSVTIPFGNSFLNNYIYYLVSWDKILGTQANFNEIDLVPSHYLYLYSQIKIKDLFNVELVGNYSSGRFDGIYHDKDSFTISAGISKSFFNRKLNCSILMNDIFFSQRDAGTFYYDDYSVDYFGQASTRYIRFSLNFKFGRLKHINYKTIFVGDEENRRIK